MLHESWYSSGTYSDEGLGLSVGWVSLPGSFADCMPMWNERRDVCLIFSGEEFADRADIESLRARGHVFEDGNASYLVHLYEESGFGFLEKLNGLFSGLLIDLRQQKIVLFNDRYGMGRIYFHEDKRGFYFSSEAKSLLKLLPGVRQLDPQGVGEFFSCGCVLQNRSLFSGVSLLPGGSAWTWSLGQPPKRQIYFKKDVWEEQPQLGARDYCEKLEEVWQQLLPKRLDGPLPVALSLTGGLDSRMILAWADRSPRSLPCYTFGGMYRDCTDVTVARQLAKLCGRPHHTISLAQDFFDDFPGLVEKSVYITDGVLDPTGAVDLYLQRKARQIAPVRITGLYGGEILRELSVFGPASLEPGLLSPEYSRQMQAAGRTYADEIEGRRLSFIAFKQAPWFIYSRFALEQSQLTLRTPYFDNKLVALAYQAPRELATSKEAGLQLIARGNPALSAVRTDRGIGPQALPGLAKLRHWAQEFTYKLEYAYDQGMPQWLARLDAVVRPLHPERLVLGKHKVSHFRIWYRDQLSRYVRDVCLDSRTRSRPYVQGQCLEKMIARHVSGEANYTSEIHRVLTLELLQRQLID
jgi:asparagine synthase (glutamine-hydrolysing)